MDHRTVVGGLVGAHGGVLAGIQVVHGLQLTGGPIALAFEAGPFVLLAATLPYVGYWLLDHEEIEPDALRILGWTVGALLMFASIGALLLFSQRVAFGTLAGAASLTVDTITVGSVVGALVGLYDAQGRQQRRELAAQRDRIEEFANTAADVNNYGRALSQAESIRDVSALCIEALQVMLGVDESAVARVEGDAVDVIDSTIVGVEEEAVAALVRLGLEGEVTSVELRQDLPAGLTDHAGAALTVCVYAVADTAIVIVALDDDADFPDEDLQLLELLASHAEVTLDDLVGPASTEPAD
jgi:hypothetical protein